jgi:hypothetical protein
MSKELANAQQHEIAVKLNQSVLSVIGEDNMAGFEKSFQIANAMAFLRENLTDEVMKPIMAMQGSKLGFKTDKDTSGGYPMNVVRDCLIDASLTGVNTHGNQFNIISGIMYITKEGYGELLKKVKQTNGLKYVIKHSVPKVDASKTFATVESTVKYIIDGVTEEETLTFSIKGNAYATADAYLGKAERKARAWLFNQVSDIEVSDGDVEDIEVTVVSSQPLVSAEEKELAQFKEVLLTISTVEELKSMKESAESFTPEETKLLKAKYAELTKK